MSKEAKRLYKMFKILGRYDLFYKNFKRDSKKYAKFKKHRNKLAKSIMVGFMKGMRR